MNKGLESSNVDQSRPRSFVEKGMRPDGVPFVELHRGVDTITCILRNGEPCISSSTGPTDFNKLSEEEQDLVRNALGA